MAIGIAFFLGRQNDDWVRRLIRLLTRGPYTHCCVCSSGRWAIESSGRNTCRAGVLWRDKPIDRDWDVIWLPVADDAEVIARAEEAWGRPFNYARVYLGLLHGLLGPLGRYLWRRFEPQHDWGEALDCTQLVYEVVGGNGLPRATDPNDLWRKLWSRGVTIYAHAGQS